MSKVFGNFLKNAIMTWEIFITIFGNATREKINVYQWINWWHFFAVRKEESHSVTIKRVKLLLTTAHMKNARQNTSVMSLLLCIFHVGQQMMINCCKDHHHHNCQATKHSTPQNRRTLKANLGYFGCRLWIKRQKIHAHSIKRGWGEKQKRVANWR